MDLLGENGMRKSILIMIGCGLMVAIITSVGVHYSSPTSAPLPPRSDKPMFGHSAAAPTKENVSMALKDEIEHLRDVVAALLQDSHNNQEASDYYKQGLTLNPKNDSSRIDYSLCLDALGKADDALIQNRIVLKHDPSNIHALFNVGALFANRGVWDSAVVYWTTLIAKHPGDPLAVQAKENLNRLTGKMNSL
jgi:tetratricopeptide (TPR) repeat protein